MSLRKRPCSSRRWIVRFPTLLQPFHPTEITEESGFDPLRDQIVNCRVSDPQSRLQKSQLGRRFLTSAQTASAKERLGAWTDSGGGRLGDRGNSVIEPKNDLWFYSQSIPRASTRGKLAATDSLSQADVGERPSTRSYVTSSAAALIFASSVSLRRVKSVTSHIDFA